MQGLLLRDKPETEHFLMFMVLKKKLLENQMHVLHKNIWLKFQAQLYILKWDSLIFT